MRPDNELLRQYAGQGDEAAFAEVVRRHTDLVYSAALRIVRDTALAQDVTQTVFTKLARVAGALGRYPTPIGWLHTTTRFTAINAVRAEARRRAREHEAFTMQNISSAPDANWEQLRPILDEAVGQLRERDRQAVLLRFFNGLSHQEVGAVLGLSENSAQKCVDRALEKLRAQFTRRGVTVSAALLATAMSTNSVQAAPVGLAADVAKASVTGAVSGVSLGSALLLVFYMSTKIKTFVVVVVIAVIMGGIWWFNQPAATTSEKVAQTAQAPLTAQTTAQRLATPVAQVEPPKLPPATPNPAAVDPQAELKTAIPDIVHFFRTNDVLSFNEKYDVPGTFDLGEWQKQEEVKTKNMHELEAAAIQNPKLQQGLQQAEIHRQQTLESAALSWEALETQTPVYNAAGDEATYTYTMTAPQVGFAFQTVLSGHRVFIKIDGKWYFKGIAP